MQIGGLVSTIGATLAQAMQAANQPLVEAVQQGMQAQAAMMAHVAASHSSGSASSAFGSSADAAAAREAFNRQMDRWRREHRDAEDEKDSEELLCT